MNFKVAILFVSFLVAVALAQNDASKANPNSPECVKHFKSSFLDELKTPGSHWDYFRDALEMEYDMAFERVWYGMKEDYKGCTFPHQWKQQCKIY